MTKVTASEIPNLGKGVAKLRPLEEKKSRCRLFIWEETRVEKERIKVDGWFSQLWENEEEGRRPVLC